MQCILSSLLKTTTNVNYDLQIKQGMESFVGYGKMSESEEREYRRRKRNRLLVIGASTFLLAVIIIAVAAAAIASKRSTESTKNPPSTTSASSIQAACTVTQYPDLCYSSISSADRSNTTNNPVEIFKLSLQVAIDALKNVTSMPEVFANATGDKRVQAALRDCREMIDDATDHLNESLSLLDQNPTWDSLLAPSTVSSIRTWLSATITDQVTCVDGFENATDGIGEMMKAALVNSTRITSNSLAIITKITDFVTNLNRKLLTVTTTTTTTVAAAATGLPIWVSSAQRRVLLRDLDRLRPNVTVAKDGSGQFEKINEAMALVPKNNKIPFVIYIKEGVYEETVTVDKNKWNVVVFGDGMNKTIVTGSLNRVDGIQRTLATATFAAIGRRFTARDIAFQNTAGPEKQQAVALRVSSDLSLFYRCSFLGFQDTLYAHSLRQFYRDCLISGTVDFIFGDAAAVFQNCSLLPRQPLPNQKNTITAHGRTDPNENTGISIQGCTVSPFGNVTADTYLGRPWKNYSTTVFMESEIGGMVRPEGWLEWVAGVVPPATIYYAEYRNSGLGANVTGRVGWDGYRRGVGRGEVRRFGVDDFIQGSDWIPETGVEFVETV